MEIGIVTLTLTLIVLTCILAILLLLHSNSIATKGYELKSLRVERHDLLLLNERLEAQIAQKKSLDIVEGSKIVDQDMVSVGKIVVINKGTDVVMRDRE